MHEVSVDTTDDSKVREAGVNKDYKKVLENQDNNNIVVTYETQEEMGGEGNQQQQDQVKKRSRGKDVWYCADPGCKKKNFMESNVCEQCGFSAKMSKDYQAKREDGGGRGGRGGRDGRSAGRVKCVSEAWERRDKIVLNFDDPVLNMFGEISNMLGVRQHKMERILRLGREISNESKKILGCLHRIKHEDQMATILGEAEDWLREVKEKLWYYVARELKGVDHYLYFQAYSGGLKEWVKVSIFYHYMTFNKIISFKHIERALVFVDKKAERKMKTKVDINDNVRDYEEGQDGERFKVESGNRASEVTLDSKELDVKDIDLKQDSNKESTGGLDDQNPSIMISVTVPQSEFVLGLSDFTGELLKNTINSLTLDNTDTCFTLLNILIDISAGFIGLPKSEAPKNIGQKMLKIRQNCEKAETACYAINVRLSEIPRTHLADIFVVKNKVEEEEEESGYFSD